ncbi:unnamed protein product [Owenia fusiformis]|uniref:Uncharacterized protein n=1 Tax=Owenia fusiformis TaxID=6347 RepID=A0A8J1XRB4_OWEFU|nr:unnamed protein product [Owenia fusiformis]
MADECKNFEQEFDDFLAQCRKSSDLLSRNVFFIKSQGKCDSLKEYLKANLDWAASIEKKQYVMQEYVQAVLDYTFCYEDSLTDSEFPESECRQIMDSIIKSLSDVVFLAESMSPGIESKVDAILGVDLTECIHWRRGALLYMYAATVVHIPARLNKEKQYFVQCLTNGVNFLESMLSTRSPVVKDDILSNDEASTDLVSQGLYSDTHVLAMMYIGEMCYWYIHHNPIHPEDSIYAASHRHIQPQPTSEHKTIAEKQDNSTGASIETETESTSVSLKGISIPSENLTAQSSTPEQSVDCQKQSEFFPVKIGRHYLQCYINAVNGPLKHAGWDMDRANELLQHLDE